MSDRSSKINAVFYANSYHPIQAGSIDGTDILPHDNAVYRALLCSSAGLYDPHGDPNTVGDPYCSLFVGQLSHLTNEDTLRKAMSRYGRVKNLRLVRHIVTGASRGYAFVEYETQRELRRAYEDAHHSFIDDTEIIVDYNRQQLMPGWIPRRLGGGLGGRKESGQLRFGGRERPFRAPLRPIPWDDLKRLGIPPPPEGHYMSRHEIPPPPRRRGASSDEDSPRKRRRSEESMEPPPRRHSRVESSGRQRLSVHRHEGRHGRDDQPGGRWHCADSYDERHAREQLPTGRWHPADDQEERHSPALSPAARRRRSTDNSEEESPVRKRSSVDKHQGSSRRRHKHGREHSGTSSRSFRERRQEST